MRTATLIISLAAAVIVWSGCATTTAPKVVGTTNTPVFQKLAAQKEIVFLIPAVVTFESATTEEPLPGEPYGAEGVIGVMTTLVPNGLGQAGFRILTTDSLAGDKQLTAAGVTQRLYEETAVLASSYKDKTALLSVLRQLAELSGAHYACVQTVKAKVGSGSTYNANTGEMAQGTSSTAIRIALVSLDTGELVWQNDAMVRHLPSDHQFKNTVEMMLAL